MRYKVMNETDGILAADQTFASEPEAEAAIGRLRQRFIEQGYYLTTQGTRIRPEDVRLVIVPVGKSR